MPVSPDIIRHRLAAVLSDQFDLAEPIGTGAFAVVFRARDRFLERDVAVKVLDPELAPSLDLQEQFLREARIVARVEHPHIVPLYSAESRDGLLYLVMRLLPGRTLADRIATEGRLAPAEAARLAHEIAQALVAAHERGVVHRDIKPENVLLDGSGHAIVTDFGVSQLTARADGDRPGLSVGTPGYMSPEQILGEAVDEKADIYSLGVVLFEMLAGHPPFEAESLSQLLQRHVSESPPNLAQLRSDIPLVLVRITKRALAKDRSLRPSAAEVSAELAAARNPDALLTPSAARWRRTRRRLPLLGIAVAAAIIIWGIWVWVPGLMELAGTGPPPRLDAMGASIPKALVDSLRAGGTIHSGEVPLYVFAPSSARDGEMLIFTDSALLWVGVAGTRRFVQGARLDFGASNRHDAIGAARGLLVARNTGATPDTLATGLSGMDVARLGSSLQSLVKVKQRVRPAATTNRTTSRRP